MTPIADTEPRFVLHEHFAKHHHFNLRLEHDGVLASWAVPKCLPEKSGERRLAIAEEDHTVEYPGFEDIIPEGESGAGEVKVSDTRTFVRFICDQDRIEVVLRERNLTGMYNLLRF